MENRFCVDCAASLPNPDPPLDPLGCIYFPDLIFDTPGVYRYKISELTPDGNGWDTSTGDIDYDVEITITKEVDGTLSATVDFPDGCPIFPNIYDAANWPFVDVDICGCSNPCASYYGLYDDTGYRVATACPSFCKFCFDTIRFIEAGVYEYVIREITDGPWGEHVSYIGYRVIVEVVEEADGSLNATVTYPEGRPNCYPKN